MSNHRQARPLLLLCTCATLFISAFVHGEEQTLLSIEGDRIGVTLAPDPIAFPGRFLDAYYALLPDDVRVELQALRQQLRRLIPDYNVAFTAADSAELTQVKEDMDTLVTAAHALHAEYFTTAVQAELNNAFNASIDLVDSTC